MPHIPPDAIFRYAPTCGVLELRYFWKKNLEMKNPSLETCSTPIVVAGITHGLSLSAQLFCDPSDVVLINEYGWDNYHGMFQQLVDADVRAVKTVDLQENEVKYDLMAYITSMQKIPTLTKTILVLNLPLNPLGYMSSVLEVEHFAAALKMEADKGRSLVVICDDAYVGCIHEKSDVCYQESIFAMMSNLHVNILAVKVDGISKEDFAWGLRVGFVTFGIKHPSAHTLYSNLETKCATYLRCSVSNINHATQSLLLASYRSSEYAIQKQVILGDLHAKYDRVVQLMTQHQEELLVHYTILPFNSGFFFCLHPKRNHTSITTLRHAFLQAGLGIVTIGPLLRICYATIPLSKLDTLFEILVHVPSII